MDPIAADITVTARAVRMMSAAMGCTAGARQTAMTAISKSRSSAVNLRRNEPGLNWMRIKRPTMV